MATTAWQRILEIADALEPRMRQLFLAAIERVRRGQSIDQLTSAILRQHRVQLSLPGLETELDAVAGVLTEALEQAGTATAAALSRSLGQPIRFDLINPHAVDAARLGAARFITNVSAETRAALQSVLTRAVEEGLSYRDVAAIVRSMVGLTRPGAASVMNYRQMLLEAGTTVARLEQLVRKKAAQKLRERALTISRTELLEAANNGQVAAWRQAAQKGLLPPGQEYQWMITPGAITCERCRAMNGKRVSLGQTFQPRNPPLHPACRCSLVLANKRNARAAA